MTRHNKEGLPHQRHIKGYGETLAHPPLVYSLILKSPHEQGYMSKALYSSRLRVLLNANLRSVLRRIKQYCTRRVICSITQGTSSNGDGSASTDNFCNHIYFKPFAAICQGKRLYFLKIRIFGGYSQIIVQNFYIIFLRRCSHNLTSKPLYTAIKGITHRLPFNYLSLLVIMPSVTKTAFVFVTFYL